MPKLPKKKNPVSKKEVKKVKSANEISKQEILSDDELKGLLTEEELEKTDITKKKHKKGEIDVKLPNFPSNIKNALRKGTEESKELLRGIPPDKISKLKSNLISSHPDTKKEANITFSYPNNLAFKYPHLVDTLGYDTEKPPSVTKLPDKGLYRQVVLHNNKVYQANKNGKFEENKKLTKRYS